MTAGANNAMNQSKLTLQEHVKECLYEDVACAKCNEHVQRALLRDHETSECRNRIVQCEHCEEEFEFWHKEVTWQQHSNNT